jgi:hypothetical protein
MVAHIRGGIETEFFREEGDQEVFGPKREEIKEYEENCFKRSFVICISHHIY